MSSYPPQQPSGEQQPPYGQQPSGQQPPPYTSPPSYGQQPQPPYGQQPQYNPYAQPGYATPTTNGLAIAAIICGFLIGPLGLIFGLISLSQINKSGGMQKGKGLAITGIVFGGLSVLWIVIAILGGIASAATSGY